MGIPSIEFTNDSSIISKVKSCLVTFSVSENFIEFQAPSTRVGEPYGRGIGELVANMTISAPNYYMANTQYQFVLTHESFTTSDGNYRISMYAKNSQGIWSDAVAFEWDKAGTGWDQGIWV